MEGGAPGEGARGARGVRTTVPSGRAWAGGGRGGAPAFASPPAAQAPTPGPLLTKACLPLGKCTVLITQRRQIPPPA